MSWCCCECGEENYEFNEKCRKCNTGKPLEVPMDELKELRKYRDRWEILKIKLKGVSVRDMENIDIVLRMMGHIENGDIR